MVPSKRTEAICWTNKRFQLTKQRIRDRLNMNFARTRPEENSMQGRKHREHCGGKNREHCGGKNREYRLGSKIRRILWKEASYWRKIAVGNNLRKYLKLEESCEGPRGICFIRLYLSGGWYISYSGYLVRIDFNPYRFNPYRFQSLRTDFNPYRFNKCLSAITMRN